MLGGSMFREFDEDPFFRSHQDLHRQHMQRVNEMFQDPFSMFGGSGFNHPMLTDGRNRQRDNGDTRNELAQRRPSPFGFGSMFGEDMFGHVNSMMANMNNMMSNMRSQFDQLENNPSGHSFSPSGHSFSQRTVMSYSNTGQGPPKVYQATTSTRQAPGGIKETRKAVRDSEAGIEKMAVGHHIHDRGHVVTKTRHTHSGDIEENEDLINLGEDDKPHFEDEWQQKTRRHSQAAHLKDRSERPQRQLAITDSRPRYERDRDRERDRKKRKDHGHRDRKRDY